MQINIEQIDKSLKRKSLYATKVLQDEASFFNGLTKVRNYLLQDKPTANSLPIFVIPYTEKLRSLFSFMVNCDSRGYNCEGCFFRNDCLKKVMKRIMISANKSNRKQVTIDNLFDNDTEYRLTSYNKEALILIKKIITQLGEIE